MPNSFILSLNELSNFRTQSIGKLAHKLANLHSAGVSVCQLMCLPKESIKYIFESLNLKEEFSLELENLNILHADKIDLLSKKIQKKIQQSKLPDEINLSVVKKYNQLGHNQLVHLFLSPTDDQLPQAILFKDTDAPVRAKGDANLLENVLFELSRYFSSEAIAYRLRRQLSHFDYNIAMNIQVIPDLVVSGIMETIETNSNKTDEIHLEMVWGLPDELLSGYISPDAVIIKKHTWEVLHHHSQKQLYIRTPNNFEIRKKILLPKNQNKSKLSNNDIEEIARIGHKIQQIFFYPQRIYWYKTKNDFYISRVEQLETDLLNEGSKNQETIVNRPLLGIGEGLSKGIKTGPVRILSSGTSYEKVKPGEIVIVANLSNDLKKVFKSASGIISTSGGQTSHVGILAREVNIAVITGVTDLYSKIKDGDVVTINGATGEVFAGGLQHHYAQEIRSSKPIITPNEAQKIHTKIFGNAKNTPPIKFLQESLIQGITGIQASEILEILKINPQNDFESINKKSVLNHLVNFLEKVIENAGDREVFYRLHDPQKVTKSNSQYNGCLWLLDHPKWLLYETELISRFWGDHKNINIILPSVRFHQEVLMIKKYLIAHIENSEVTKNLWVEISTANPIFEIEEIIKSGIEGVFIDLDKLSSQIANIENLDELDIKPLEIKGFINSLEFIGEICKNTDTKLVVSSQQIIPNSVLEVLLKNHFYGLSSPEEYIAMYIRELHSLETHQMQRQLSKRYLSNQ